MEMCTLVMQTTLSNAMSAVPLATLLFIHSRTGTTGEIRLVVCGGQNATDACAHSMQTIQTVRGNALFWCVVACS